MKFLKIFFVIALQLATLHSFAGDAALFDLTLQKYIKTNSNKSIKAKIKNVSGSNITSFTFGWKLDTGVNHISVLTTISGAGLSTAGVLPYEDYINSLNVSSQGQHVIKVWVTATGDSNHSNDTITFNFKALALNSYVNKVNLFEESTGTWCQYCPAANTALESIKTLPRTSVASFHTGDIYSFTEGNSYFNAYFPSTVYTPAGIFNMGETGSYALNTQSSLWSNEMYDRSNSISPVELVINPTYNITSRQLDVNLTSRFKYSDIGDYYVNVYLVEDGVIGTQVNATNPYTHNNIVRKMLGGIGTSGIIPTTPVINVDYSNSYSFAIPSTWNVNNLRLIGLIYRKDGTLKNNLNAINYQFSQLLSNTDFSFSPNPASDFINIENISLNIGDQISIFNIEGQLLLNKNVSSESMNINISEFQTGVYIIKVKTENGIISKKFIKK